VISNCKYKVRRISWHKWYCVTIPNRNSIPTVRNKIRHRVIIRQKRAESNFRVLIEDKLDEICAGLEHSYQKSPGCLSRRPGLMNVFTNCYHLLKIKPQ
jgi:hypothetical protein